MNYIILFATGLIIRNKIKGFRIFLASLLGGIYSVLTFASLPAIYSNVILKVLLSIAMVYIAFHSSNVKQLLKQLILFYLVSFAFGGCAFALLYFIKPQEIFIRNGVLTGTYPIKVALLGGIVGFVVVTIAFKVVKGRLSKKDMFCNLTLHIGEKTKTIKAFIDTGNLLKDPISGMPVIVVEAVELEEMLPRELLLHIGEILEGKKSDILSRMPTKYQLKFRMIPFSSLGKQNGLLLGFLSDGVEIETEERTETVRDVIVGIYEKNLTKNGAYTGLVGIDIIERCGNYEHFASFKGAN